MMRYEIHKRQQLNCDLKIAWSFFSSPYNLSDITPKNLGFVVLSDLKDKEMYEGMEIQYKLKPLLGISTRWETKVVKVEQYKRFTDVQKKGPYKLWIHEHEFIANSSGLLMKDYVIYEMPLGILGRIIHALVVQRKLKKIFDYRYQVLDKMFNRKT